MQDATQHPRNTVSGLLQSTYLSNDGALAATDVGAFGAFRLGHGTLGAALLGRLALD